MRVRAWRVWYSDGEFVWWHSSADLDWSQLPRTGVQIVKVFFDAEWKPGHPYTRQLDGCDWYYRAPDGSIEGVKSIDWKGYRPRPCGIPDDDIKRGTGVSVEMFAEITAIAAAAKQCP